ncbi:MAG: hypothetical protein RR543_02450 [Erysipelotrichales bacterium]
MLNNNIEKLLKRSMEQLSLEEYDKSCELDKKIIKKLKVLNSKKIRRNNIYLNDVRHYLATLGTITRYQQDSGVDNASIVEFSNMVLEDDKIASRFGKVTFSLFLIELIISNVNIHRVVTFQKIFEKYESLFDDVRKTELMKRLLTCYCGELSIEKYILPIFNDFDNAIFRYNTLIKAENSDEKKSKHIRNKRLYLSNIIEISMKLDIEVPKLIETYREEIESCDGFVKPRIITLMKKGVENKLLYSDVEKWLTNNENLFEGKNHKYALLQIKGKIEQQRTGKVGPKILPQEKMDDSNIDRYRSIIRNISNKNVSRVDLYQECKDAEVYYQQLVLNTHDLNDKKTYLNYLFLVRNNIRYNRFWSEFETELNKVDSVKESDTVIFFVNDYSLVNGTLVLPFLIEGKRNGYHCLPTSPRTFSFEPTSDEVLNELAGTMNSDLDLRYDTQLLTKYNWEIDIPNKKIVGNGMNIYQPIFEFVSRYQFSYFFNYETDAWARARVHSLIHSYDRVIQYCEEIEKWAKMNNKKVRFISNAPHIHHAAAYRIYCEEKGYKSDMNFVVVSPGYDNYFKNVGDAKTETLTILNMTKNEFSRNSFLGTKSGFEQYYKDNEYRLPEIKDKVSVWFDYQRSHLSSEQDNEEKARIIKLMKKYKSEGKKVIVLNGKVVFDLCVKYTKGCAHNDMSEWITNTVEIAKKNKDILLLIKPHPHEERKDLTLTSELKYTLRNLIKTPLAENTIYLDNNAFKIAELVDYMDLGILWNGTSALEFAAQGIKTLVCDVWGHYDYPIGFIDFNTVNEYEYLLKNCDTIQNPLGIEERAIMFLDYMGSDAVRMKNPYTMTSSLNFFQYTNSKIFSNQIDVLLENGNKDLETLFRNAMK